MKKNIFIWCFLVLTALRNSFPAENSGVQDFLRGVEVGTVVLSLYATVLETHSLYSSNVSLYRAFEKNYSARKAVQDSSGPILLATLQIVTLACSQSSVENNCPVLNSILAALNIWRISYCNSLRAANHQDLLVRTTQNQRRAAQVIADYNGVTQQLRAIIQDGSSRIHQAEQSPLAVAARIVPVVGIVV